MPDVIVIGGGVNGLVAACALARERLSVLVLEQRAGAGGGMITSELAPGFRAPTLSHSTVPLHTKVLRQFKLASGRIEVVTPDVLVTAFGRDGVAVNFYRDPAAAAASIARVSDRDAERWPEFRQTILRIRNALAAIYEEPPPGLDGGTRDLLALIRAGRRTLKLPRRDLARIARWIPMSIADLASEWFEHDLVKAAVAAHAIFGNKVGPRSGGTGGMWLQRLLTDPEPVGSSTLRRGGPGTLPDALVATLQKMRGTIRTDARVVRVDVEGGRVRGVTLDSGEEIAAKVVVSAVGPRQTFLTLVSPMSVPPTFRDNVSHYRAAGVTAKINLALASAPDFPALGGNVAPLHGRLLIAPGIDYLERAYDASKYGEISDAPWLDISVPSLSDATLAPAGQHVMSIAVHYTPRELRATDWTSGREVLWRNVLAVLGEHTSGLASQILAGQIITPEDLETGWGLSGGHIFHGETSLDQSWVARPFLGSANYDTPIFGLFLTGAGTHPGGGAAGLSGLFAARAVGRTL